MTEIQFFAVVAKMRAAQRKFYSLHSSHPDRRFWLNESKRLEKIVDDETRRRLPLIDVSLLKEAFAPYSAGYTSQMTLPL